ncbi:hypothetical protein [Sphingomonas sp. Leaf242]|uniref:hypothetical protein n=1 Tax=Sphingomonas sp. Leaf242 TaxID=1736304 RepID=UPI000714F2DF|nr:hypothetical protein [Sphingomonas sp. Leaf242]KQO13294.1 hypothetical protein ASF09_03325 [Sphingomonas sp. Leaf242]
MKTFLRWAGVITLALSPAHALAQAGSSVQFPAGYASGTSPCVKLADGTCAPVSPTNPLPIADGPLAAATSTPLSGTATTGTIVIGPFIPQLGRAIRVILRGTWTGTFAVSTSVDACATLNPLTIGGSTWGSFTGNANEVVDIPTLAGVVYCATATVSSGSLSYGVRN